MLSVKSACGNFVCWRDKILLVQAGCMFYICSQPRFPVFRDVRLPFDK